MSDPYIGEVRMFAGNFAPQGWFFCDGQLLNVSQYDALFSLLGTIYGGDGRTTFGLPDLRGRIPRHAGSGPGLSPVTLGTKSGSENVTLTESNISSHGHRLLRSSSQGSTEGNPINAIPAQTTVGVYLRSPNSASLRDLNTNTISTHGGSNTSIPNEIPFLCVNFIIAWIGIYPTRT